MKKYGVDGKKRFSVKYSDGTVKSFGTCNPKDDERMDIVEKDGKYFLVQYQIDTYEAPEKQRDLLPEGTLVTNGYYDHEWDGFVSITDFLNQQ